ncbi:MAG: CheR family methyltransferase, partial [Pseudomonadota bacterium]
VVEVKDAGGVVFVQEPTTAKFDGMPKNALTTGKVDWVGAPTELAGHVARQLRQEGPLTWDQATQHSPVAKRLNEILGLLRLGGQHDFSSYRHSTLIRRIERRVATLRIDGIDDYVDYLTQSEEERRIIASDLLIGVTRFFREEEVWTYLRDHLLPNLISSTDEKHEFRVWVPGCSTGQEAYTIAMLVDDCMAELGRQQAVKIFASDIDQQALDVATSGEYDERVLEETPSRFVERYFRETPEGYVIRRNIREMVIFARHDLLRNPPFTRINLMSCRNLLIYLDGAAQANVLSNFYFSLTNDGVAVLGPSESLGDLGQAFEPVHEKYRIFRKNPYVNLPASMHRRRSITRDLGGTHYITGPGRPEREASTPGLSLALHHIANTATDPSLLLSSDYRILHSFGNLEGIVVMPPGEFTQDAFRYIAEPLRKAVATGVRQANKNNQQVCFADIGFEYAGKTERCDVRVDPLTDVRSKSTYFLVLFIGRKPLPQAAERQIATTLDNDQQVAALENELQVTRENLQVTVEELETSNEELQASNEELMASNEELQSTNEELHSVNEELQTVNSEFQEKINELTTLTADFENLLVSTNIGTIFLDAELRIRRFTPAVNEILPLVQHDVGRPINHFNAPFIDADLESYVRHVIDTSRPFVREMTLENEKSYIVRIMPFVNGARGIEGAVITFVDVTPVFKAGAAIQQSQEQFSTLVSLAPLPIALIDDRACIGSINPAFSDLFGFETEDVKGRPLTNFFRKSDFKDSGQSRSLLFQRIEKFQEKGDGAIEILKKSGDVVLSNVVLLAKEPTAASEYMSPVFFRDVTENTR